jgi:hypothetical protein
MLGVVFAVASLFLAGCRDKSEPKEDTRRESPAANPAVHVAPSSSPRGYHQKAVENGKAIGVRVSFAHPKPPPSWPIPPMVRSQCAEADHVVDEAWSASADGGANGAVIWIDDIHEGRPLTYASAVLDQKRCVFTPHVLALPAAGTLTLTNGDPANHADRFEFGGEGALDFMRTLPGGGSVTVSIPEDWAGRIARISCPIHLWMGGYALFFEHPYFAVTQAGRARLEGVPTGNYHLLVWHEGTTSTYDSKVVLAPPQEARVEVTVADADIERAFVIADDGRIAPR